MNFSQTERDFTEENEAYVPIPEESKPRYTNVSDVKTVLAGRTAGNMLDMKHSVFTGLDLSGWYMTGLDLSRSTFDGCNLNGTDCTGSKLDNVAFYNNDLRNMKLNGCMARGCSFRFQDMTGIDLSGANIYASVLEDAVNQDKVIYDENTRWYEMSCPEYGKPFIAWKCCTDLRVVMMLVPADAKRCMATMETGRVSKIKVLSIKSIDEKESYTWAQSTVDPDFYYEVGKWLEPANGFQEDRWKDSSPGIHFFLDRQQCVDYQSK